MPYIKGFWCFFGPYMNVLFIEAKIAFLKFHHLLAFNDDDRPIWSHAYDRDKEWIFEKLKERL
jgi:hypothetical protein